MEGLTEDEDFNEFRKKSNYWFTIIFILELTLKVVGMGFKSKFIDLIF